jgi:hypothetical protein
MKYRWLWSVVLILLLLVAARQAITIRQLRSTETLYDGKVKNAFRYTGQHMDLSTLPQALEALSAQPDKETLQRAQLAAESYSDMLLELNDLAQSGPPLAHGALSMGTNVYYASTEAQMQLRMQVLDARLWPPLYAIGVMLPQAGWQLRPEEKQFLADVTGLVRQLNKPLADVETLLQQERQQRGGFEYAQQQLASIGPQVDAIASRVKAFQATLPTK